MNSLILSLIIVLIPVVVSLILGFCISEYRHTEKNPKKKITTTYELVTKLKKKSLRNSIPSFSTGSEVQYLEFEEDLTAFLERRFPISNGEARRLVKRLTPIIVSEVSTSKRKGLRKKVRPLKRKEK